MMRASLALACLLASACGGLVVYEEDGGAGGGSGVTGPGSVAVATAAQGTSVVASSSTGGNGGDMTATIVEAKLGANCMPVVGPDPIYGSVLVEYANQSFGSSISATVSQVNVSFVNANEGWVFPIALTPSGSGDVGPGGVVTLEHAKAATDGDSSFVCQLCGQEGTVTVDWTTSQGASLQSSRTFEFSCAF